VHGAAWWVKFLKVSLIEIEAIFIRPARPCCTIVEDDAEISELAAALFSREALAVGVCRDGAEVDRLSGSRRERSD